MKRQETVQWSRQRNSRGKGPGAGRSLVWTQDHKGPVQEGSKGRLAWDTLEDWSA